jgi:hypothetical protein
VETELTVFRNSKLKKTLSGMTIDQQLIYCSVKGNLVPVVEDLTKLRDEKAARNTKLTDDIDKFFKAKQALSERADTHLAVGQTIGDRSKVESADKM